MAVQLNYDSSVSLHLSLAALPEPGDVMPARVADPRIGYFSTCFELLGSNGDRAQGAALGDQDAEARPRRHRSFSALSYQSSTEGDEERL